MTHLAPASNPVRILAWIHLFLGIAGLLVGTVICLAFYQDRSPRSVAALQFVSPIFLMAAILYLVPAFIGGVGLLAGKSWARIPIIGISALLLLMIPLGTALGGFGFWALANRDKRNAAMREQGGLVRPRSFFLEHIGNVLLTMVGVGAGSIVVLDVSFQLNGQIVPVIVTNNLHIAAATLLLALGYGIYRLVAAHMSRQGAQIPGERCRQLSSAQRDFVAEKRQRLAELAADPARRQYVARIERGEAWSDERIAYHQDPGKTATCVHLQQIERAMRAAGLELRLDRDLTVIAPCSINESRFRACCQPASTVHYVEIPDNGRSYEDPPSAALKCDACRSTIYVVHPMEVQADMSPASWPPP